MRAELGVIRFGPCMNRLEKGVVRHLGKSKTPVVTDCGCFRADVFDESKKMGTKIVSSAPLEFVEQGGTPIGAVIFKTVAEDGVGRVVAEG